jgi:hypothetical protein
MKTFINPTMDATCKCKEEPRKTAINKEFRYLIIALMLSGVPFLSSCAVELRGPQSANSIENHQHHGHHYHRIDRNHEYYMGQRLRVDFD